MAHVILHAGLHKTGTTYLQEALALNRDRLLTKGVSFPQIDSAIGHNALVSHFRGAPGAEWVAEWLADALDRSRTLVLSAEEFSTDFNAPAKVDRYRTALAGHSVQIVYYLRRQDDLRESVFAEICRNFYTGHISDTLSFRFDFEDRMSPVLAAFPGQVMVRPYNPRLWTGGDLFLDFLDQTMGIDARGFFLPPRRNESIARRKTVFLSRLEAAGATRRRIAARIAASDAIGDDGIKSIASPTDRAAFVARFEDSNRRLLAGFGIDDIDTFFGPSNDQRDWHPPEPLTETERAQAFDDIAAAGVPRDAYRYLG